MEISQVSILHTTLDDKTKLADDICRLLQVRDKNKEMIKDWLLFISTSKFKITPGEIYLAFQMTLSRQILDEKGNQIDLFPELSNNTTGKVIYAYLNFKKENLLYQNAKDKLKALNEPLNEITEIKKKMIRDEFLKTIFNEIVSFGFSIDAHHLFLEMEKTEKFKISNEEKKKLYDYELQLHIINKEEEIKSKGLVSAKHLLKEFKEKIKSGKPLIAVRNKCRSIVVCNYLINHLLDFETFKKSI